MCGIFGALFVPDPSTVDARAALRTQQHRGPDAQGLYERGDCVLGHNRLSIIDLSPAGAQPMVSADDDVALVFNGEIYNHHELRDSLVALGHSFRGRSDTEVILEGYREWGDAIVEKLDGMFAICILDRRNRRALLARDRSGKKPLFFTTRGGGFRFASEIKALLASGVDAEVDPSSFPSLLVMGYTQAPRTMLRGIEQLAPASKMVVSEAGVQKIERYWRAPFVQSPIDDDERVAEHRVRELVEAAVVRRLEADVPLGAFLSGGIDSTIIVGVMARAMGRPVKTFSIGFSGDARFDETHYARIAAKAFNTHHTEFVVEPSAFDLIEKLVWVHDGPFGDSSAIPTSIVSKLTREHVTVALTGDGGDEVFCGYSRFLAGEIAGWLPSALWDLSASVAQRVPDGDNMKSLRARAKRFLRVASRSIDQRMILWNSYFGEDLRSIVRRDLHESIPMSEPFDWNEKIFRDGAGASDLSRILQHNFEGYLPYDLLVKADRSSMLHSLEVRSPFLDTALIEYAARLPDRYRRRGTNLKRLLKNAFRELLPNEIFHRGKMGFGVPLGAWFRGELRQYVRDFLRPGASLYSYLDQEYVQRVLEEHFAERADHGQRLWLLLTIELWLRGLHRGSAAAPMVAEGPRAV
ncbi:MAG: asparagine synthase (glutamine-hydrolyzing) [Polyangiales bacterium]